MSYTASRFRDEDCVTTSDGDTVMVDPNALAKPPRQPREYSSHISDTSNNTSAWKVNIDNKSDNASHSGSDCTLPDAGLSYATVPSTYDDELKLLRKATVTASQARRSLKESQEERPSIASQDSQASLEALLAHSQYQQKVQELKVETARREKCEILLTVKDTQLNEAQSKSQRALEESEKKNKLLEDVRKLNKKLAGDLNKLHIRVSTQAPNQLTDQCLVDKIDPLRYSIRNFAIQYFDGDFGHDVNIERSLPFVSEYVVPTTRRLVVWDELLRSPRWRASQIQATLWRCLRGCVFGQFRWAGTRVNSMRNLHDTLRPDASSGSLPDPEAERKFQIWSTTTTALLLDRLDIDNELAKEAEFRVNEYKKEIVKQFFAALEPWRNSEKGARQALYDILGAAMSLDLEISRQIAQFMWVFEPGDFEPSTMVLDEGEKTRPEKQDVQLIVAPGLKKRGKSNGEDFKTEILLLKSVVRYVPCRSSDLR